MQAQKSELKLICRSADEAFLSREYHKWRKYEEGFMKHQPSDCHTDFNDQSKLKTGNQDVEEMTNKTWSLKNWQIFLTKFQNTETTLQSYQSCFATLLKLHFGMGVLP